MSYVPSYMLYKNDRNNRCHKPQVSVTKRALLKLSPPLFMIGNQGGDDLLFNMTIHIPGALRQAITFRLFNTLP
jgi:hypothetical protein